MSQSPISLLFLVTFEVNVAHLDIWRDWSCFALLGPNYDTMVGGNAFKFWIWKILLIIYTGSSILTMTFQVQIWAWRRGFSHLQILCSWWLHHKVLCQAPFRFLKSLIWARKEVKVRQDFQPCFAGQKAHRRQVESILLPWNLLNDPWKLYNIEFSWIV